MNDEIIDDLIVNKQHYVTILAPLIETLEYLLENEDKLFKDDVLSQFEDTAKWVIAKNIHHRFNITIEDAYILLEDVKIRDYLRPTLIKDDLGPDASKTYKDDLFEPECFHRGLYYDQSDNKFKCSNCNEELK